MTGALFRCVLPMALLAACSPQTDLGANPSQVTALDQMQAEHMERCLSRIEYQSREPKRIEKHCRCIFKTAMKGRSEDEQMTIAFYLYGDKNEAFQERFRADPPSLDAMGPAVEAVAHAAKTCRL